jgi:hypothetical protein
MIEQEKLFNRLESLDQNISRIGDILMAGWKPDHRPLTSIGITIETHYPVRIEIYTMEEALRLGKLYGGTIVACYRNDLAVRLYWYSRYYVNIEEIKEELFLFDRVEIKPWKVWLQEELEGDASLVN